MTEKSRTAEYYLYSVQIASSQWRSLNMGALLPLIKSHRLPPIIYYRQLALELNKTRKPGDEPVLAAHLNLFATLQTILRYLVDVVAENHVPGVLEDALRQSGAAPDSVAFRQTAERFVEYFPPDAVQTGDIAANVWLAPTNKGLGNGRMVAREMLLLRLAAANPAIDSFRRLLDDRDLARNSRYAVQADGMHAALKQGPYVPEIGCTLGEALWTPILEAPDSLAAQVGFFRERLGPLLPAYILEDVTTAFDILLEEQRERGWGGGEPGPPPVLEFGHGGAHGGISVADGASVFGGYDYPEHEAFSQDADWMPNVVMMAKMVYVWLDQLTKQYGYPITRLDQIPDAELATLARRGFTGLWLIGVWERSIASQRVKQLCGNPDAIASAYSLYDYEIAADLGGWAALANLRERAGKCGVRLASDMVPNHTGIYSRWVLQHPDWFVQTDYPPFPTYQFNGEDLSHSEHAVIQVEDSYWTKTDAAVVFRMIERSTGRTRYIYHGNDGTSIPWNDTAQLNYLLPEVREAVIQTILHVARNFPIIRFDAAMTLAKKHYQRLWFPIRGLGGGIPSRAEHGMSRDEFDAVFPVEFWRDVVDRVAAEAPGTLLLAEAFWMMEGYFVRTLGMHRVYNSAFMNMLKKEENAKYRQTIRNVLEFNPEVLQRFVNFMNNPDEKTAVAQFGSEGKYFGACLLMSTMPGLPMFGHGQIEGFQEKYGMEYKRAYWDEQVDEGLVRGHEMWIFPILRRRGLFSGAENFALYDFYAGDSVDENVYAYSNRVGEQRALVLFHNCHARTAGWIRESAAFAVKGSGEEPELQRSDLGTALGVSAVKGVYYAFRDHTRGLEYLRSGQELHEKGLFAELGEYEFHVFMDFRELVDEDDAGWGLLCRELNGCGVDSLADELKQLRHARQNAAFRAILEQLPVADKGDVALVAAIQAFQAFQAALIDPIESGKKVNCPSNAVAKQILAILNRADKRAVAVFGTMSDTVFGGTDGIRLLLSWLLLRDLPAGTMERLGLDCTLRRLLGPDIAGRGAALVAALCATAPGDTLPQILATPAVSDFLLTHESESIVWFNKERFEELTAWLGLIELLISEGRITVKGIGEAGKNWRVLCELAGHAGYRTRLLLDLLIPATKDSVIKPVKKNAARKATDAQVRTRKSPTKTPDHKIPR